LLPKLVFFQTKQSINNNKAKAFLFESEEEHPSPSSETKKFVSYLVTMEINDPINEQNDFFFIGPEFGTVEPGRGAVEDDQVLVGFGHLGLDHEVGLRWFA
jgi:hypothetical protein